jgi:3-keto-disaccharide hydrolase
MRCLVSALILAILAVPSPAAENAKPNTLTPKEIADGWLLLFDGETTFGWKIDGEAKVEKGKLVLGGVKETTAIMTTSLSNCGAMFDYELTGPRKAVVRYCGGGSDLPALRRKAPYVFAVIGGLQQPRVPLAFHVPGGSRLALEDVKMPPPNLEPIFNGKDLTGWKIFPGRKSQFTVSDGELHIKNGNGDLQTEAFYDDFVLQLDCKTNGKHLNSGVFFRCIPGQYQNGYEAQIHNDFTLDPPKEYTVDEYDPETHKLIGKKKVKSAARDFGTGAIYRRIPARKPVATDNEWFTMTIVAEGRHMAVWVNGIQVTDWIDNRPLHDNPRNGCRLEKGAISLQGHDPTTDLSFRNIRIAPLPKK